MENERALVSLSIKQVTIVIKQYTTLTLECFRSFGKLPVHKV